jgi:hypothetical protein
MWSLKNVMEKNRFGKNRVGLVFVSLIFIFMLGTIYNIGIKAVWPAVKDPEAAIDNIDIARTQIGSNAKKQENILDRFKSGIHTVETKFSNNMILKLKLIDVNGFVQKLMNKHVVNDASPDNAVIKSSDGRLHFLTKDLEVKDCINNIKDLNSFCSSQNIPVLYVQTPPKVIKNYTELPRGILDHSNSVADKMSMGLKQNNIKIMDLRNLTELDDLDKENMFYITDHHWTYTTAFWAFSKIVQELNTDYGFHINKYYTNLDNYQTVNYGKWFLGTEGARVGKYYAGVDDFSIIVPNFSTEMEVRNTLGRNQYTTKSGDFQQAIISQGILEKYKDTNNLYHVYFSENYQETIVKNKSTNIENKKMLIIKDSFGLPVSAFLALTCFETHLLDLRAFSSLNLYDYIKEYKPDIVMFMYNPGFYNPKMFVFK